MALLLHNNFLAEELKESASALGADAEQRQREMQDAYNRCSDASATCVAKSLAEGAGSREADHDPSPQSFKRFVSLHSMGITMSQPPATRPAAGQVPMGWAGAGNQTHVE